MHTCARNPLELLVQTHSVKHALSNIKFYALENFTYVAIPTVQAEIFVRHKIIPPIIMNNNIHYVPIYLCLQCLISQIVFCIHYFPKHYSQDILTFSYVHRQRKSGGPGGPRPLLNFKTLPRNSIFAVEKS